MFWTYEIEKTRPRLLLVKQGHIHVPEDLPSGRKLKAHYRVGRRRNVLRNGSHQPRSQQRQQYALEEFGYKITQNCEPAGVREKPTFLNRPGICEEFHTGRRYYFVWGEHPIVPVVSGTIPNGGRSIALPRQHEPTTKNLLNPETNPAGSRRDMELAGAAEGREWMRRLQSKLQIQAGRTSNFLRCIPRASGMTIKRMCGTCSSFAQRLRSVNTNAQYGTLRRLEAYIYLLPVRSVSDARCAS